ncbi:MAG: DCC1-like thiol-disulfide oxidoreductase family protein [Polyangiales bacterium]
MDHALSHPAAPALPAEALGHDVVLVDGYCIFCNRLVAHIARADRTGRFYFVHIQSDLGQAMLRRNGHDPSDIDTVYLVTDAGGPNERLHLDDAAGRIIWPALYRVGFMLRFVPLFMLNLQYRLFARVRYRLFGASDVCIVPSDELRARVLSAPPLSAALPSGAD